MQGFRPRNRPSKHSKPQNFEYESHFIEFQGGEAYQCKICTGCPDFHSLSDAVDHESSRDHIEARRQLDRVPPPLALGPVPGEDVPNPMYLEPAEGNPPAPGAVPTHDAPRGTESDWHAAMEHWAKLPNAHFTVPGPALPTDPPSAVYNLFGAATDKWGSKSEQEETNSEPGLPALSTIGSISLLSSLGELWNHATILRNGFRIEELAEAVTLMNGRFDKLTASVEKDLTPSKFTQTALKQNLRRCAATVKTTYRTLANRAQNCVRKVPGQYGLQLYSSNDKVKLAVNQFISKEAHQCRGSLRKFVFAEAVNGRVLSAAASQICEVLGADVSEPTPKYVLAHIAQLRIIAHRIITDIRAKEQADHQTSSNAPSTSASASTNAGAKKSTVKKPPRKPRNDTGFWFEVDKLFAELTEVYGVEYKGAGWEKWEDDVIKVDGDIFIGVSEFPGEAPFSFMDDDED
ncbi:hypothetical protein FRC12_001909 [Ceratobasidium sp. 428]|nr:hypothetical protein FRC12_001909 [Ceratobasidium sp. 428]